MAHIEDDPVRLQATLATGWLWSKVPLLQRLLARLIRAPLANPTQMRLSPVSSILESS